MCGGDLGLPVSEDGVSSSCVALRSPSFGPFHFCGVLLDFCGVLLGGSGYGGKMVITGDGFSLCSAMDAHSSEVVTSVVAGSPITVVAWLSRLCGS